MVVHSPLTHLLSSLRRLSKGVQRVSAGTVSLLTLALTLTVSPALAGDPFRPNDPHAIGDATEATFRAMFFEGDYGEAKELVGAALRDEPAEPMNHAIAAALAYLENDWEELQLRARTTQDAAQQLLEDDPLRGHLYRAVGIFLDGAYVLQTQGIARGTPTALRRLQQVFAELDAAEDTDPDDPELSLLKGFMDLLLAVNLPFANPDQAIARLRNGYPAYLSHRGVAIGYRDLGRYEEAITEAEMALTAAPENPDLMYLKGQIYWLMGNYTDALPLYEQALTYADQLPASTVDRMRFEKCLSEGFDGPTCSQRIRNIEEPSEQVEELSPDQQPSDQVEELPGQ